jgi:hypothetical protein
MSTTTTTAIDIQDVETLIKDLCDVEQKSIGTGPEARDAAAWVSLAKDCETSADAYFDPAIKTAYASHKKLVAEKKGFLELLIAAKDRVRSNLANWIAGGHPVDGCYIKRSFKIIVIDPEIVPQEYWVRKIDEEKILEWIKQTDGKMAVPGVQVDPVNVLYSGREEKKETPPPAPILEQLQKSLALDDSQPPMPRIAMQRTRGKNLVEIAWSEGTLWCGFARKEQGREHGISVYSYRGVPEAEYLKILHSPFPDRIFQANIKSKYSAEKYS